MQMCEGRKISGDEVDKIDEVELKSFDASRRPSIDAEAPPGLAEVGRSDWTKPNWDAIAAPRANNG